MRQPNYRIECKQGMSYWAGLVPSAMITNCTRGRTCIIPVARALCDHNVIVVFYVWLLG